VMYVAVLALGYVGARLLDIATQWGVYSEDPSLVYSAAFRGFSLYGGLVLAAVAVALLVRPLRVPLWRFADSTVPGLVAAVVLMRVGCFLRGCCFGNETALPWGVTFPVGSPAWSYQFATGRTGVLGLTGLVHPVHPTQLYEMLAALVVGGVAMWLMGPHPAAPGASAGAGPARRTAGHLRVPAGVGFLAFALGFTLFRVAELFLRPRSLGVTAPAWLYPVLYSVIIVATAAVLVWRLRTGRQTSPGPGGAGGPTSEAPGTTPPPVDGR
jgi:phosphatidylglycerol:prolipoprotein diacylglycerol transferase